MRRNNLITLSSMLDRAIAAGAWAHHTTAAEDGSEEMFIGKADAPITMIAYESLVCPHCAAFHATALPLLKERYVDKGQLKIVFREWPGSRDNPFPAIPAMMARCMGKDRYFPMVDLLFKDQEKWTRPPPASNSSTMCSPMGGSPA
jgi:protein-disulfide isomerase